MSFTQCKGLAVSEQASGRRCFAAAFLSGIVDAPSLRAQCSPRCLHPPYNCLDRGCYNTLWLMLH